MADPIFIAGTILSILSVVRVGVHVGVSLDRLLRGGPSKLELKSRGSRYAEYGIEASILLDTLFPDALDIMIDIEEHVLHVDDRRVREFMEAHTSSFSMIGVAGAIIAQVAITGLSLTRLQDSHWTAEAFFIISLVTGALSVYFSCAISPAFNGLYSADDIKNFLTKPASRMNQKLFDEVLYKAEQQPTRANLVTLEEMRLQFRWQVPSVYAAIMLLVPMRLLNFALNAFLIGLGIYLGKAYTAKLIPSFGSGSLGILIIFIGTALIGIVMYYSTRSEKSLEDYPLDRYRRLMYKHRDKLRNDGTFAQGHGDTRAPTTAPRSAHQHAPEQSQEVTDQRLQYNSVLDEWMERRAMTYEAPAVSWTSTSVRISQSEASDGNPPDDSEERNTVAVEDTTHSKVETALQHLIKVQALNLEATQRLLEAHRMDRELARN